MKRNIIPFILLPVLSFFLATCKKSGSNNAIVIQGFYSRDYNGSFLGWYGGPADNDWTFMTGLSSAELSLFNFDTGLSLDNTVMTTNPNNVDAGLHVVTKQAFKTKGSGIIQLSLSNRAQYPNHASFRAYYSYSAKDHPDYKVGYGDIRICDSTALADCF